MKTHQTLTRLWRLLLSPSLEWDRIAGEELPMKTVRQRYVVAPACLCMLVSFLCGLFYAPAHRHIETATADLLATGIVLFGTYALTVSAGTWLVQKTVLPPQPAKTLRILESYAMSCIFATTLLISLMPQAGYLNIAGIYSGWLIHTGHKAMLPEHEEQRSTTVILLTLCIAGLPFLLRLALKLLLPNL